jgi:hypothetical protein
MINGLNTTIDSMTAKTNRNLDIMDEGIPREKADRWRQQAKDRVGEDQ